MRALEVHPGVIRRVSWRLLLLICVLSVPAVATEGPQVGEPRPVLELDGLQSCRFLGADAPGGPALVCGRLNEAAFAWEIIRVPLDEAGAPAGEPTAIGYGSQPDVRGSMLAWVGTEPDSEGVWLDDLADDEPPVRLTLQRDMTQPSIAADGETVACTRRTTKRDGIFLVDRNNSKPVRLAYQDERQPVWGPTGTWMLAIKSDHVWLLDAPRWEELVSERLTDEPMVHFDPAWGPRGEWITFAAGWTVERAGLALMHLASRRTWWPVPDLSGVRSPAISEDRSKLAFIATEGEATVVYVCALQLK